jgi:hypothetical protein
MNGRLVILNNWIIFLLQIWLNSSLVDQVNYRHSFRMLRFLKYESSNYFENIG